MKNISIILLLILAFNLCLAQPKKDYRTIEDGITQLINNEDFIDKINHLKSEDLANLNLEKLFIDYVPDYADFKIDKTKKIDLKNIFYEKGKTIVNEQLYKTLGRALNLNMAELDDFKSLLSGKISPSLINNITGTTIGSDLSAMVNNPEGYLKSQLSKSIGGGAVAEKLVNIGFNWLSQKEKELEKQEELEKQAKERRETLEKIEKKYNDNQNKLNNEALKELTDAYINASNKNYIVAINKYSNAINLYKQADGKEYEIMKCYQSRGYCKNGNNDYRGAIVDNYLALIICNKLLAKRKSTSDKSSEINNLLGSGSDVSIRTISNNNLDVIKKESKIPEPIEKYKIIINRAYSKFLAGDFDAAIEDCKMALDEIKASDPEKLDWTKNDINEKFVAGNTSFDFMMLTSDTKSAIYNLIAITGLSYASQKKYEESESYLKYIKLYKVNDMPKYDFVNEQDMLFTRNQFIGLPNYFGGQIFQTKVFVLIKQNKIDDAIQLLNNYTTGIGWALQSFGGVDISNFYITKASIFNQKKEYQKSILCLDSAIQLKPREISFYKIRSDLKKLAGDLNGAKEDMKLVANPNALSSITQTLSSIGMEFERSKTNKNRAYMEISLLNAIKNYPDSSWTLMKTIDISFDWIHIGDIGKVPTVYQNPILNAESIEKLIKSVQENSNLAIVLNAIKYGLKKDAKNCYPFIAKFWNIDLGYEWNNYKKITDIEKILPKYDQYPEYCSYAKLFIEKEYTCLPEVMKTAYKNTIENYKKVNVNTEVADYYLKLHEYENAILFCDKEIKAEGKSRYDDKTFYPAIIKTKIKALFALDRNKEAVQIAKKYLKPQKNYEIIKEVDGNKVEYEELNFIKNIAQDYCGYDK